MAANPQPRLFLVEDHPLLASALTLALRGAGYEVVANPTSLGGARRMAEPPGRGDLAIVDLSLPDGSGLELVSRWSARGVRCLVFTGRTTATHVRDATAAGALGFVSKVAQIDVLLEALRVVSRGEAYHCREARLALEDDRVVLTPREREVLALVAEGRSNRFIAETLGIAVRTVETHRERLMQKLHAHNAADLTREAMRRGLIGPH